MRDLKNPRLLYFKAFLFLLVGLVAAAGVMLESMTLRTAIYLIIAIWCFCRAYYFAFYVIEHYLDPTYRFAGLFDFAAYVLRHRRRENEAKRSRGA
jgi:hypothetical protein